MSKRLKTTGLILAALLVVVGAGVWWFVLRDTAAPKASLDAIGRPPSSGREAPATPDGDWKVQPTKSAFAGYRIRELFAGSTIKKTATGRTSAVAGSLTVRDGAIPEAEIRADLTKLTSKEARRDSALGERGIETDRFPGATFVLTSPISLPASPESGRTYEVKAAGDLTLHGVSRPVTFAIEARWDGATIAVAGSTPIELADYEIDPIEIPGFVKTDDRGTVELQLTFARP